ncbi:MAG: sulfatase-like hydrolase/transferase [Balneolaceae bacterium]|nr:sulfatase-like hydrolase/transferase [Balneolaceae bacterium]
MNKFIVLQFINGLLLLFKRISTYITVLILGIILTVDLVDAQYNQSPPNVIILFTDDHGTLDVNSYGSNDLHTPNMDALADRGVKFTQFYAAAAVCTPSRVGLLTGRYPLRVGLTGNAESHPTMFGDGNSLPQEEVTIAEMLQEAGYKTAQIGKWHLGTSPGPNGQGFDYSFGFLGGVVDQWSHFNYGQAPWGKPPRWHDLHRNGEEIWEAGTHIGDLIVRESIDIMEAEHDQPFFLYLAFGLPHYPLHPYDHYMEHYKDLEEPRRSYAASVSTTDEQIGRIVEKVDELGIRDNTLIIFQSDHGHSTEARAGYGGGNAGDYRGAKFSFFEGGIRVPAIASMPGTLPEGVVRDQIAHGTDWLPTIAEITGADLPRVKLDGENLLPVLLSDESESPHDVLYWSEGMSENDQWAVRKGPWKLIGNPRDTSDKGELTESDKLFLSNLEKDKTEMVNFAEQYPDIVKELTNLNQQLIEEIVNE